MDSKDSIIVCCIYSISACVFLTILYVASLYIWNSPFNRDHPSTIKKRFFSVFCMMLVAPLFLKCFLSNSSLERGNFLSQMGLRLPGLIQAIILPLILTAILFLGPMTMHFKSGLWKLYAEPMYWRNGLTDLVWVRNHLAAPISEEWVFRACMMPLLLQCFNPLPAVFLCPLLFGIAHFHHMIECLKSGLDLQTTIIISCFQFSYTTLFGAYSAFLFARTGHFVAPLVAHMFCNHMGFPNISEISLHRRINQIIISACFVLGLILWCLLLTPFTTPSIYYNTLHWNY